MLLSQSAYAQMLAATTLTKLVCRANITLPLEQRVEILCVPAFFSAAILVVAVYFSCFTCTIVLYLSHYENIYMLIVFIKCLIGGPNFFIMH